MPQVPTDFNDFGDFVERVLGGTLRPMYMASEAEDNRDEYAGMYS
jgi:hypothetical protein